MKKNKNWFKKIKIVILILSPMGIFMIYYYLNVEKEKAIKLDGSYYLAKVERIETSGNTGSNYIYYSTHLGSKKITLSDFISDDYYVKLEVDDTVLIKAIISDTLTWSILQESKRGLIPCLKKYKQPQNGWEELPINECKE